MSLRRNIIVLLAALVVAVQLQMIPRPISDPIEIRSTSETVSINGPITVQHLPGTEKIVVAWPEVSVDAPTATIIMGAIVSTAGDILTPPFEISPASEPSNYLFSPPVVVPRADGNFSVLYRVKDASGANRLRDFNPAGIALTDPMAIANPNNGCYFTTAAEHKSSGNLILGCTGGPTFVLFLVDPVGNILNSGVYSTPASQTIYMLDISISGDYVAVAVVMLESSQLLTNHAWVGNVSLDSGLVDFNPFNTTAITYRNNIVPDPFAPDYFYLLSISTVISESSQSGANIIQCTRFNASGQLATNYVAFDPLGLGINPAVSSSGSGILFMSVGSSTFIYHSFGFEFTDDEYLFAMNETDFEVIHTVTDDEAALNTQLDVRHSATAWETGNAVGWPEIVGTSNKVMIQLYGSYCGDNVPQGSEQCDGGVDCNADCTCPNGLVTIGNGCGVAPVSPPQTSQPVRAPTTGAPASTPQDATSSASIVHLASAGFVLAALF